MQITWRHTYSVGCLVVALLAIGLASPVTGEPVPTTRATDPGITTELKLLLEAKTYREIAVLPQKWRASLSGPGQRELISQLLARLVSRRSLPLAAEAEVLILPEAGAVRDEREIAGKTLVYKNLTLEQGRCAWAIEELLLYTIQDPSHIVGSDTSRPPAADRGMMEAYWRDVWLDVAQTVARGMPPAPAGWPANLQTQDRLRLAESSRIDPRVLRELSHDAEANVRCAVAGNGHTDFYTLLRLCRDTDAKVAGLAKANRQRARTLDMNEPASENGR